IVLCKKNRDLKKIGMDFNKMIKVPFEKSAKAIVLRANTDFGVLRLGLDTGATLSVLRTSSIDKSKMKKTKTGLDYCTSKKFVIGDKDFRTKNFCLIPITPEL